MPELRSINFEMIRCFSKGLREEVRSWTKDPWSWDQTIAQYQRLHSTQELPLTQQ